MLSLSKTQRPTAQNSMKAFRPAVLRRSWLSFCSPAPISKGALAARQGALTKAAIASTQDTPSLQGAYYADQGETVHGHLPSKSNNNSIRNFLPLQSPNNLNTGGAGELPDLVKYSQLFAMEIKHTTFTGRLYWMTGFKKCSSRVESKEKNRRKERKSFLLIRVRGDRLGGLFPGSQ